MKISGREDIDYKLRRAEEHLVAIGRRARDFENRPCAVVLEKDLEHDVGWLTLRLPEPDVYLSVLVGDCLYNLRSSLDHLIWQIVLANPPNKPRRSNMFPICDSDDLFKEQLGKGRLREVPKKAVTIIEGLQPYDAPDHPLRILDNLHNIDKHRALNLITNVAEDVYLTWSRDDVVVASTIIGNEDVYDGARLIGFTLSDHRFRAVDEMQVQGQASTFVAFQDVPGDYAPPLDSTLESILDFIRESVIPALDPFLDEPPGSSRPAHPRSPGAV